jgi:hypothetical protein
LLVLVFYKDCTTEKNVGTFQSDQWPDLLAFLCSGSPRAAYTLSVLSEVSGEAVAQNFSGFVGVIKASLEVRSRVARFFLDTMYQNGVKISNDHKIMTTKL